jgi:arginine exporter protein ArgO
VVLVLMGLRTARSHYLPAGQLGEPLSFARAARTFLTTFSLTILNPATLLGFIALFASMSDFLRLSLGHGRPAVAVAGVMLGSFCWWLLLSFVAVRLRARLSAGLLIAINHWAGVAIAAIGFLLLMHALF